MNDKEKTAIRCAFADLIGAVQAMHQGHYSLHDWGAHISTIEELKFAFPWLDEIPDSVYYEEDET